MNIKPTEIAASWLVYLALCMDVVPRNVRGINLHYH